MNKTALTLLWVIILAGALGATTPPAAATGGAPSIHFPEQQHDFGTILATETVRHEFKVVNRGDAPLVLTKARATCGCTVASFTRTSIPPGGEGAVTVSFSPGKRRNEQQKSVTVSSNDPENPSVKISIRAFVEPVFDFESPVLDIGKVGWKDRAAKTMSIRVRDAETVKVTGIESTSEFISARMLDETGKDERSRLLIMEVSLAPGLPTGRISESITVHTDLPDLPTASLRVSGQVVGEVEVSPERLRFVAGAPQTGRRSNLSQRLFITSHLEEGPLEVLKVADPDDRLDFEIKPLDPGRKIMITATVKPEAVPEAGRVDGTVEVTTNAPSQQKVSVRYSAERHQPKGGAAKPKQ